MNFMRKLLWLVLLLSLESYASPQNVKVGDLLPDFTLKALNGYGQNLEQARGKYLMLVWLDDCNDCADDIIRYQILAESFAFADVDGWFIWESNGRNKAPEMRLPMLQYEPDNPKAWLSETRPAVMLISPNGRLNHLILGDLKTSYEELELVFLRWINSD